MQKQLRFFLLLVLLLFGVTAAASQTTNDRYFAQTGYSVDNDMIWEYFQSRGGVDTFGYPVSDLFGYRGFDVQIFQRHVLQLNGSQARPLNLLDPDVMPINSFGGLTFPEYDQALAASAPAPDVDNYGEAVSQHLEGNVPSTWQNQSVGFLSYYLSAAPQDAGNLRTLLALEVWGFPTSQPQRDPNNQNFIYQRFQRGIMHYDATNNLTRGILLGDAFKSTNLNGDSGSTTTASLENSVLGLRLLYPDELQVTEAENFSDQTYGFSLISPQNQLVLQVSWLYEMAPDQLEAVVQQTIEQYPGLNIERSSTMIDGQPAIVLSTVPGINPNTYIYVVANSRLYRLIYAAEELDAFGQNLLDGLSFIQASSPRPSPTEP